MSYKRNCKMFDEISMGNPGKVPYCSEQDIFEPDCTKCYRPEKDNGDLIRSLMDSKLAEYLFNYNFCSDPLGPCPNDFGDCKACIRAWLQMPVKEGE